MEQKLDRLYKECISELNKIGINILTAEIGEIRIGISSRSNKRYGCCRQEEPDKTTKYYQKIGRKNYIRYARYKKHYIEISVWVMKLEEQIIKNTIMHEIIHCFPYCNNHGSEFKKYAKYINEHLGYEISRVGNKKEDYIKSNLQYEEEIRFKYRIMCQKCGQTVYRQRLMKNLTKKYKCGKCSGKLIIECIK